MKPSVDFFQLSQFLQLAGFALLLLRLYTSKLAPIYRYFTAYVAFQVVRVIVSIIIPYRSNAFGYFFFTFEPIVWLLSALAILEVYGIVLRNHPGIATWGRWGLIGSIGASVLVSLCTMLLDYQNTTVKYPILVNFFLLSKLVTISLLVFVVLITLVLLWFPIVLNRNTVVHCCVFAAYFLIKSTGYVVALLLPGRSFVSISIAIQILVALCCLIWVRGLTAEGETIPAKIGHSWDAGDEERLLAQLDAINQTLVESSKSNTDRVNLSRN